MSVPSPATLIVSALSLFVLSGPVHALTPDQIFNKVKDSVVIVKTLDELVWQKWTVT